MTKIISYNKNKKVIAIIAHDNTKVKMLNFVNHHLSTLSKVNIVCTETTGSLIEDNTSLEPIKMLSGPMGGDAQIAAKVAERSIEMVLFFKDPLGKHPHEPDINMLLRVCDVHNVPLATNFATAEILINSL